MKKILLTFLIIIFTSYSTLSFGENSWNVTKQQHSEYITVTDLISQVNGTQWTIRSFVNPDDWFPSLEANKQGGGCIGHIDVVADFDEQKFELFKFDCELDPCTVNGYVELGFKSVGALYVLEPVFHIQSYTVEADQTLPTTHDIFKTMVGKNIVHEQPVKYFSRSLIVFDWDPQDTWYPEQIQVFLEWEDRSILRSFIADCFKKCHTLRVYGEIHNKSGGWGNLAIIAHRVEKPLLKIKDNDSIGRNDNELLIGKK